MIDLFQHNSKIYRMGNVDITVLSRGLPERKEGELIAIMGPSVPENPRS